MSAFRVLIAGGGIGGIEAMMAIADIGDRDLGVTVIDPVRHFVLRPRMIGEPWGGPPMHLEHEALAASFGARFVRGALSRVDRERRRVVLADGTELDYDALIVALGARPSVAYAGIPTVSFGELPAMLASPRRADMSIVVPPETTWTLPAYQLGLLARASGAHSVTVRSCEPTPLEAFGPSVSRRAARFLSEHGVAFEHRVLPPGMDLRETLDDEVIVALPLLHGPALAGLPHAGRGFVPVDDAQYITPGDRELAVGDVTYGSIKQGGLASQQGDRAALEVVCLAGLKTPVEPAPAVLRGKLVAGADSLYLRRLLDGVHQGQAADSPLWMPEGAVCAWRLSRWLAHRTAGSGVDALGPVAPGRALT